MNDTAFDALRSYITDTTVIDNALAAAQQDAEEFGLAAPDAAAGSLLSALAASYIDEAGVGAIAVTPAAGVVGLYLLRGLGLTGTLTCIDPETEHQRQARTNFMAAGYKPNQFRFLPSRPLEVMSRLAADSYHVVYGDIRPSDYRAFIDAAWPLLRSGGILILANSLLDGTLSDTAWPLLRSGGILILANSLLDGTLSDTTRKDRDTICAREADEYVRSMDQAVVCRLPLGSGLTLITKKDDDSESE